MELEDFTHKLRTALESKATVALVLVRIDDAIKIRNAYGLASYDRILDAMGSLLLKRFSAQSTKYGLSYLVLLLGKDADDAYNIAESIRKEIESLKIPIDPVSPLPCATVHIGISPASDRRPSWFTLKEFVAEAEKTISDGLAELSRNRVFVPPPKPIKRQNSVLA